MSQKAAPLVSIIMPTYNHAAYVREAVRSVQTQTYENWELLVQDDGSTDGTREFFHELPEPRIRYEWQPNSGLPAIARNRAISRASGELIAFLDSDDLWLPNKLERQVLALDRNPGAGMVYCRTEIFDAHGVRGIAPVERSPSGNIFDALLRGNFISNLTVMIRGEVLRKTGSLSERREIRAVEDYELWMRVAHDWPVIFLPEILARYRIHGANISGDLLRNLGHAELAARQVMDRFGLPENRRRPALSAYAFLKLRHLLLSSDPDWESALACLKQGMELSSSGGLRILGSMAEHAWVMRGASIALKMARGLKRRIS